MTPFDPYITSRSRIDDREREIADDARARLARKAGSPRTPDLKPSLARRIRFALHLHPAH